jgi:hypothetical protein
MAELPSHLFNRFIPGFIKRLGVIEEGHQLTGYGLALGNLRSYLR